VYFLKSEKEFGIKSANVGQQKKYVKKKKRFFEAFE